MKVAIKFDDYIVGEVEDLAPLLKALTSGKLYTISGWGFSSESKLTVSENKPSVHFVDDGQFVETPEPFKIMQDKLAAAESRWYDYYKQAEEAKKKAADLQEKLDQLKVTVTGATA